MTYADHNLTEVFMNKSSFLTFIYLSLPLTPTNPSLLFILYIYMINLFVWLCPVLVAACGI